MKLLNRKSLRLKNYDYSSSGYYFITISTKNREYFFNIFPELAEIIEKEWNDLIFRFKNIELDEFIIMPNHIHGIIFIKDSIEKIDLGDIVGAFKSKSVNEWLKYIKTNNIDALGKFWHRNYHESIIRDEEHLNKVREYIKNNPMKWKLDGKDRYFE